MDFPSNRAAVPSDPPPESTRLTYGELLDHLDDLIALAKDAGYDAVANTLLGVWLTFHVERELFSVQRVGDTDRKKP